MNTIEFAHSVSEFLRQNAPNLIHTTNILHWGPSEGAPRMPCYCSTDIVQARIGCRYVLFISSWNVENAKHSLSAWLLNYNSLAFENGRLRFQLIPRRLCLFVQKCRVFLAGQKWDHLLVNVLQIFIIQSNRHFTPIEVLRASEMLQRPVQPGNYVAEFATSELISELSSRLDHHWRFLLGPDFQMILFLDALISCVHTV